MKLAGMKGAWVGMGGGCGGEVGWVERGESWGVVRVGCEGFKGVVGRRGCWGGVLVGVMLTNDKSFYGFILAVISINLSVKLAPFSKTFLTKPSME